MRTTAVHDRRKLPKALAASTLAVALLAASIVPSSARPDAFDDPRDMLVNTNADWSDVQFRRHFFRGQPGLHAEIDAARKGSLYRVAPEVDAMSAVVDRHAYCSARFKSYDPATGRYLGYDGQYRVCT